MSLGTKEDGSTRKRFVVQEDERNGFQAVKEKVDKNESGNQESSTKFALLVLVAVFVTSISCLAITYYNFPKLDDEESKHFKLPKNMDDAKALGKVLSHYKERYYFTVMGGFFMTYIFLQSFAIPGSIFLSILSGFLFPFPAALFLVCLCSALGASFCFLLSYLVGRKLVTKYIPGKVAEWSQHVNNHRSNLLNYIIFLRITPFLPNWFINITSPVIDVPLLPFFIGTFLGVAPPSFVAIRAGTTLQELTSSRDALSWSNLLLLALFALLAMAPVIFKKRLSNMFR